MRKKTAIWGSMDALKAEIERKRKLVADQKGQNMTSGTKYFRQGDRQDLERQQLLDKQRALDEERRLRAEEEEKDRQEKEAAALAKKSRGTSSSSKGIGDAHVDVVNQSGVPISGGKYSLN